MPDLLQRLTNEHILCKDSILEQVDPYTLYCYYYGEELVINQPVISTVREDDNRPSFCIYYKHGRLRYHDYGRGENGDIFDFIKKRYGLSFNDTLKKINHDFQLGYEGEVQRTEPVIKLTPKIKVKKELKVTSRPDFSPEGKAFWDSFHISESILNLYNVKEVEAIHIDDDWFQPSSLCFVYYIGKYLKLYYPYNAKGDKFFNNYPRNYVEGYLQLPPRGRLLILTKSLKDVMTFRVMGIPSVSPKGENVSIPEFILKDLESRFDRIITFFDPDEAGYRGAERYRYPARYLNNGVKDVSDYTKAYGLVKSRNLVAQLIHSI